MFGLSHDTFLLVDALIAIVGLILLITRFRIHPFIALTIAAGYLGLTSGMPVALVMKSYQDGFGGVLGFVGIVLALGTMLGKLMAESGAAAPGHERPTGPRAVEYPPSQVARRCVARR